MATRRTPDEVQNLLEGYRQRIVTRAEYSRQQGLSVSALDYYLRRYGRTTPRFARVKVMAQTPEPATAFALVLRNGRRIESTFAFPEADLARLIRIAEAE